MTKKQKSPNKGGRPPIPESERLVPLNMKVKPKTKEAFEKLASELKLSNPKTLEHLLKKNQ